MKEIVGVGEVTVTTAAAGLDGVVPTEDATMVTLPQGGIVVGGIYIVAVLFAVCDLEKEP